MELCMLFTLVCVDQYEDGPTNFGPTLESNLRTRTQKEVNDK